MIQIVTADGRAEQQVISAMRARQAQANAAIEAAVAEIFNTVKENGFSAVRDYSLCFDHAEPREIRREELDAAYAACPGALIAALEHAAANIRDYNEKLLSHTLEWSSPDGGVVGRIVRGLKRVGVYVPGGTAAYPSSVLMNAVPAKVAGVEEIVMVTPPTGNLNHAVLAAAKIAGVDRGIAVGVAQAVAALTYGAGFIPRVDKLVGPGNAYVAAAKRMAYGTLDIDMVAGPSEVLVIADETARPKDVAADLLSQAEHDKLASAILVTTDEQLAETVVGELERQCQTLSRSAIIREALENYGAIIVCDSVDNAVALANEIAPEHLEVCMENPLEYLGRLDNAGSVFLGQYAPEPLGDYYPGPNHVLPTSGTARFFSPLSVDSFVKKMGYMYYTKDALSAAKEDIVTIAEREQLTAHANSIKIRFE